MGNEHQLREVFPPSDFIKEEMEARGWSLETLATQMLVRPLYLEPVMADKMRITKGCALALGRAFGTDPEYWLNLQKSWDDRAA